jgi:hypothetical protein
MPFPLNSIPREWNLKNIEELPPRIHGIYGISNCHFVFLYIGKAEDVRDDLLQHFKLKNDLALTIADNSPAFFYIATDFYDIDKEEASLICEFVPVCNNSQPKRGNRFQR